MTRTAPRIVVAEDDPDDRMLGRDALAECGIGEEAIFVEDGDEALDFLHRRGEFAHRAGEPLPELVLLDLNMPRRGGYEALRAIQADPTLASLTVVVLTTSSDQDERERCQAAGARAFFTKPATFEGLVETMRALQRFLPGQEPA